MKYSNNILLLIAACISSIPNFAQSKEPVRTKDISIKLECGPIDGAQQTAVIKQPIRVYVLNTTKKTIVELDEDGEPSEPLEAEVFNDTVIHASGLRYGGEFYDIRKDPKGESKFHVESRRVININRLSGAFTRSRWPEITKSGFAINAADSFFLRKELPSFFCDSYYPELSRSQEAGNCRVAKQVF